MTITETNPVQSLPTITFTKRGDAWLLRSTSRLQYGAEVTVSKRDGSTTQAIVDSCGVEDSEGVFLFEMRKPSSLGAKTSTPLPEVPEGYYAVTSRTGNNDLDFFAVDRPTEGRWAGYVFVKRVIGGHVDTPVRGAEARMALEAIVEQGVSESQALYGREIGRCGACNRTLTDELSRELGIGPTCRNR